MIHSETKVVEHCCQCHKDVVAVKVVYNHEGHITKWETVSCSVCGTVISDVCFQLKEFPYVVGKYVRKGHVQTDKHWSEHIEYNEVSR